jgi:isopentenyl-diphosphate delta-isomerase
MSSHPTMAMRDTNLHELITAIDSDTEHGFYPISKLDAHIHNVPHVAVSIFVFHDERLLLQKRAQTKYHSGGLWANTVCSHPRWNESARDCADRRLQEELGWAVPLKEFGRISYAARVGELYENEYVHCFQGAMHDDPVLDNFNQDEVSAIDWLTLPEIMRKIEIQPNSFSAWFKIYMSQHRAMIDSVMRQNLLCAY